LERDNLDLKAEMQKVREDTPVIGLQQALRVKIIEEAVELGIYDAEAAEAHEKDTTMRMSVTDYLLYETEYSVAEIEERVKARNAQIARGKLNAAKAKLQGFVGSDLDLIRADPSEYQRLSKKKDELTTAAREAMALAARTLPKEVLEAPEYRK